MDKKYGNQHFVLVFTLAYCKWVSPEKTHPLVPGVVTVCDVSDRPGGVQSFSVHYQCPVRQTENTFR